VAQCSNLQEICKAGKSWENYPQRLLISRFQVRVLGGSLKKYLQIMGKRTVPVRCLGRSTPATTPMRAKNYSRASSIALAVPPSIPGMTWLWDPAPFSPCDIPLEGTGGPAFVTSCRPHCQGYCYPLVAPLDKSNSCPHLQGFRIKAYILTYIATEIGADRAKNLHSHKKRAGAFRAPGSVDLVRSRRHRRRIRGRQTT
jgi:hypothetical protein